MPLVWDRTRRAWQLGLFSSRGRAANRLPKRSRTTGGTQLVKDIAPGAVGSLPHALVSLGGGVFFAAAGEGVGSDELWRSDGTPGGTYRVKDIRPGSAGGSPPPPGDVN